MVRKSIDVRFKWNEIQVIWIVKWFEIQTIWLSIDVFQMILFVCWFELQVRWASPWFEIEAIWLSIKLRFKWFGCQSIWDSSELVVHWFEIQMIWLSIDARFDWFCLSVDLRLSELVVNWSEIQEIGLPIALRFKRVGCQSIWDSDELVVNWFEIQAVWMSNDLRFKWFGCQLMCESNDFVKRSFSARLPSKMKLWRSKTKLFCETSFKNEALKIKKRSIAARLPSKMKLWSSKTKHFCKTSFKNEALKIKKETFLQDFLQKWSFEDQKRSFSARLPSKMKLWRSKTKHCCETSFKNEVLKLKNEAFVRDFLTSFKNDMLTRHLTSEFQYVLTIFKWMLQKYCACREKVEPRHTNCKVTLPWHEICNPSTDSASEASNIDITKHEILAPATRNASFQTLFKSTTPANVFATLTNSCACHVFCNVSKSLRLPRENHFELPKMSRDRPFLTMLTSKSIARAQAWREFCGSQLPKALRPRSVVPVFSQKSLSRAGVVQILSTSWGAGPRSHETMEKRSILRNSYRPKSLMSHICAVKHLCCPTSMLQDLPATFSIVGS